MRMPYRRSNHSSEEGRGEEDQEKALEGREGKCSSRSSSSFSRTLKLVEIFVSLEARGCHGALQAIAILLRLLIGCSALLRSLAERSEAASESLAKDLDLPVKKLDRPLLRAKNSTLKN